VEIRPQNTQADGKMPPLLFLVAWDRPDLWDYLRRWFSGIENVQVVLDRRRGTQRQRVQVHAADRRRSDRRRQTDLDDELRSDGFVITRP